MTQIFNFRIEFNGNKNWTNMASLTNISTLRRTEVSVSKDLITHISSLYSNIKSQKKNRLTKEVFISNFLKKSKYLYFRLTVLVGSFFLCNNNNDNSSNEPSEFLDLAHVQTSKIT